ncbi:DUF3574 domain-containing protein [Parvibaculum sp.]|uniref:DUF3574 domain-containing protein n=1 Tax=Parvibaculum sp. TaxID=2024848 RepID=UPI002FD8D74B
MHRFSLVVAALAALLACSPLRAESVETTLYFGLDLPGGEVVSEEDWKGFLADVVTPRFPDGFTVIDAYGQWRDPSVADAPVVREATKVLVIVHPATVETSAAVAEIKSLYKARFDQKSVFHTDASVIIVE